ncbi:MAG: FkbM family methyltransferase [Pyrinomonadaceae bacterium]
MGIGNKIKGIGEIWQFDNHWQLFFNRLFFSGEKINVYRLKNLEFICDHSAGDVNGAREVLTTDMYRGFLAKMELTGPLKILDLGSNNGGFPLLLASENKKIEKLVCVEFNPETFSRLRFNIERNLDCEFTPLNVGVCGDNREIRFDLQNGSGTSVNIYGQKGLESENGVRVPGETFDQIYERNFKGETVDICKMDIEGAEFEVFGSGKCLSLTNCRYLLIEIHHEKGTPRDLVLESLSELGFREADPPQPRDEFHHVHLFFNKKF